MTGSVRIEVYGIEELEDGFSDFVEQLAQELAPGFVPESRYRGMMGEPFTVEKVSLVAGRLGFVEHG